MPTVLIGGGTGLVGNFLSEQLAAAGYEVRHLSRSQNLNARFPAYRWDTQAMTIDKAAFDGVDYLVNLAGAGIADARWTEKRKRLIIDSRVQTTALLAKAVREHNPPLKAFVSASAIGYYGDRGEEWVDENSAPGKASEFLAHSVQLWESAIEDFAKSTAIRTAAIRIGVVLSTRDGALPKVILPMRLGVASYFSDGQDWFSWIHIEDLARLFQRALEDDQFQGFYNGVAPNPVRNKAFALGLKEAMGTFAVPIPAPSFALRLAMGEMADVVLSSTRVSSAKVEQTGFAFKHPDLVPAMRDLLERNI